MIGAQKWRRDNGGEFMSWQSNTSLALEYGHMRELSSLHDMCRAIPESTPEATGSAFEYQKMRKGLLAAE